MRNVLLMIGLIFPLLGHASTNWPGLSPDCWQKSRAVHSIDTNHLMSNLSISKSKKTSFKDPEISPNKGYMFSVYTDKSISEIKIYSEKDYDILFLINNVYQLSDLYWLNEKLIYGRVWWGRIVGTDFIYDVENESMIYQESITDSAIAFEQYQKACKDNKNCGCANDSP